MQTSRHRTIAAFPKLTAGKREFAWPAGYIRQIQLAKGAIRTGIDLLLAEAGIAPEDLEKKAQHIKHLPLAEKSSFQDLFVENLNFPQLVSKHR